MKKYINWAFVFVFCLALALVDYNYARNYFQGFTDDPQKNVVLQQGVANGPDDLTLTVQPPMATQQIQGHSQLLALEFFNRSANMIKLHPLQLEPHACFTLDNTLPAGAVLQGHETSVVYVNLRFPFKPDDNLCLGEHPLTVAYSWTRDAAGSPQTVKRLISSSPISISTESLHTYQRFVRIGKLMLMPVLLAGVTFVFQRQQSQRDQDQNRQALTIEVWKVIYPTFFDMVKAHYMPISRSMASSCENISGKCDTGRSFLSLLLLRRRIMHLLDKDGGYYFQSKRAEDMCSELNNHFVTYWETLTDQRFDTLARLFGPTDTLDKAESKAGLHCRKELGEIVLKLDSSYPKAFPTTAILLQAFSAVLDFESDRPLYPKWYAEPPKIQWDPRKLDVEELSTQLQLTADQTETLSSTLVAYRKSIPRRCRQWK